MPTAVLDLDFFHLPQEVNTLERYDKALVLLRLQGHPVGQALLPIVGGRLQGDKLRDELMLAADSAFWERLLQVYLAWKEENETSSEIPPATVAICTRDRPEDLRLCLEALKRLPDDGQEILVVDNCPSTEASRNLVEKYKGVRYVREELPGLDIARNRALREARHEIIVFTDDDAAPDPNWLRMLLRNFNDPLVVCVTGLTMPIELETEAQEWFQRLGGLGRGFKRTIFDSENYDPLEGWQVGAGVNMALRRSVVEHIGNFDERFDVGTPTRGGGDTEFFFRVLAAGYRIIYDPKALTWHRHRSTWTELSRQLCGYEMAGFAFLTHRLLTGGDLGALEQAWNWVWRELGTLSYSFLGRPGCAPLDLVLARFHGATLGPWAYFRSHWRMSRMKEQL